MKTILKCFKIFFLTVNPEILNKMYQQVEKWKLAKIPGTEGLANLVVHLLLRSDGGCQVIRCLLNIMPPTKVDIHTAVKMTFSYCFWFFNYYFYFIDL